MAKRALFVLLPLSWLSLPVGLEAANTAVVSTLPKSMKSSMPVAAAVKSTPIVQDPTTAVPAYQLYNYYGDRYRDPFIALNGEYHGDQGPDRAPQISSLLLKGIIQDANSRMALLTSGVSSYILRGGRLYDGRNHLMKGISGVVKPNSVVLMGSDRTVRELKVSVTL